MKRKQLERLAKQYGWWLKRHGTDHDIWTNGYVSEPVPRHNEVREMLAKKIVRKMRNNPGDKE